MIHVIVLSVCISFIAFFSLLGLWYLGFFPLLFLIIFFSQEFGSVKIKFQEADYIQQYGLYALGFLVYVGILGILDFMQFPYQTSFFILTILSWGLRYMSYFIDYKDGKILFNIAFLFSLILSLGNAFIVGGRFNFLSMLGLVLLFLMLGFGGLWYGVGTFKEVDLRFQYYFFFSVFLGILDVVFLSSPLSIRSFNIDLLLLGLVLFMMTIVLKYGENEESVEEKKPSLRRILAGEKILHKEEKKNSFLASLSKYIIQIPYEIKLLLEYLNVGLLLGVIGAYLIVVFQGNVLHQLWYWVGIGLFLINAFLLRKQQIFSIITRFAIVIMINFSLYISLLVFGEKVEVMLPWLIAWNILCGILVFYTRFPTVKAYVKKLDIIFWLLTTLVAMLLNIVLLLRLNISGQIAFSLIFIYVGIQGIIAYYALELIKNYEKEKSDSNSDGAGANPLDVLMDKEISL